MATASDGKRFSSGQASRAHDRKMAKASASDSSTIAQPGDGSPSPLDDGSGDAAQSQQTPPEVDQAFGDFAAQGMTADDVAQAYQDYLNQNGGGQASNPSPTASPAQSGMSSGMGGPSSPTTLG